MGLEAKTRLTIFLKQLAKKLNNFSSEIYRFKTSRKPGGDEGKFAKKYTKIVVNELEILADTKNEPFYVLGVKVKGWRKN